MPCTELRRAVRRRGLGEFYWYGSLEAAVNSRLARRKRLAFTSSRCKWTTGGPKSWSTQSGLQNVKVGRSMNLQVKDLSGKGGSSLGRCPVGPRSKTTTRPFNPPKLTYLSEFDRLRSRLGSSLSQSPLSFAWVTGGTRGWSPCRAMSRRHQLPARLGSLVADDV